MPPGRRTLYAVAMVTYACAIRVTEWGFITGLLSRVFCSYPAFDWMTWRGAIKKIKYMYLWEASVCFEFVNCLHSTVDVVSAGFLLNIYIYIYIYVYIYIYIYKYVYIYIYIYYIYIYIIYVHIVRKGSMSFSEAVLPMRWRKSRRRHLSS